MENIPPEISNITFSEKYLYLNCPQCKEIPLLSLNENNPEKINIKCHYCSTNLDIYLNDYLSNLSSDNSIAIKKNCTTHNNYLDKYCLKCHVQFCTKCEMNKNEHGIHSIRRIKLGINLEQIKYQIEKQKIYFQEYISDYINEKLPIIKKIRGHFEIYNLMKLYINSMKNFFLLCDNVLSNYDPQYPDYYQQSNLMNISELLKQDSPLIDIKENRIESILIYSINNFVFQKNDKNIMLVNLIDFPNDNISDALFINYEFIIVAFENFSLKIYNYPNKNLISTIENNFEIKDIKFNEIKLSHIYKNIFAVILKHSKLSIVKLYSINSNTLNLLFEKKFDVEINIIKKINNNSLGIVFHNELEIYKLEDTFENISQKNIISKYEIINKIKTPSIIANFIQTQDDLYIIIACEFTICIYKSDNFSLFKKIELSPEGEKIKFNNSNIIDDNKIILFGKKISIFTINNSSYKLLYDEKIKGEQKSYLASISQSVEYSNCVLTYCNKLICKRNLTTAVYTSFEDQEDTVTKENSLYIFDYDPKRNTAHYSEKINYITAKNIYNNYYDSVIIVQEKKISLLYL